MSEAAGYSTPSAPGTFRSPQNFHVNHVDSFQVHGRYRFDQPFPPFQFQSQQIGFFSENINGEFKDDNSQLKYFVEPAESHVRFDLKTGYEYMIRKDENVKTFINHILKWIMKHQNRNPNTDFVCWRGLLTRLMCTPYERRDGWIMAVTLFNGTYYLCEFDTETRRQREQNKTIEEDMICCGGWKFEQYLTADTPGGRPNTDSNYNNIERFCTVVQSQLKQHSLVFAGEVDAVCEKPGANPYYVEMKTTKEVILPKDSVNLKKYKYIKWWAQSSLVGIPEIVCGFRNGDKVVTRLEKLQTETIPELIQDVNNPWKPNVCFTFLDEFLTFIKRSVRTDDHRVVHLITWEPEKEITCMKVLGDSEFNFLPEWYTSTPEGALFE